MSLTFQTYTDNHVPILIDIWNKSMKDEYGFFPLTPERLRQHYYSSTRFDPNRLLIAYYGEIPQGFIHYDLVDEPGYERAGVISALAVIPEHRLQGVGSKLLEKAIGYLEHHQVKFIDAAGAWPYSSFYATLIDGSERAGINQENKAAQWLLSNFYFYPGRRSYTMLKELHNSAHFSILPQHVYSGSRRGYHTWLDHAFRDWELFDHELLNPDGVVLSRCIYARMDGQSNYSGKERYAIFGVHTPEPFQGMGYATANLKLLCNKLISEGIDELELHVYQDNAPAVKLYQRIGFTDVGETTKMQRY